jgi:glycerol-3-phosphate dehydrogenase (NAD(P)+)
MPRVAVVGAGSWGTTVAALASAAGDTVLWARRAELAAEINTRHTNSAYLPGFDLPHGLRATADLAEAVGSADVVVMGVPSHGFREIAAAAAGDVRPGVPVVSLAKGLEQGSQLRMTEVAAAELPGHPVGVLTGPNLAAEVLAGQPAASVVAFVDLDLAAELQGLLSTPTLRIYTNPDVVGCELAGVVKNVIAIAAGMCDGMGFGDNSKATVITRGLAEMARLGMAMGGEKATFAGLAGMGDLIATCASARSRNNSVGRLLGEGQAIGDIVAAMNMVAEGVKSSPSVLELARRHDVEMPIVEQVAAVCSGTIDARTALSNLMSRASKSEFH